MAVTPVPAGWHPDPFGRHELRYSDGRRWTDHVADDGRTGRDPAQPAALDPAQPAALLTRPGALLTGSGALDPARPGGVDPTQPAGLLTGSGALDPARPGGVDPTQPAGLLTRPGVLDPTQPATLLTRPGGAIAHGLPGPQGPPGAPSPPPVATPDRPWPTSPPTWFPVAPPGGAEPARPRRGVPLALVWTCSLVAVALVAVLVAVVVRQRDPRAQTGRFDATVAGAADVDRFEIELGPGDALVVSATPDPRLDVVIGYAADRDTAAADFAQLAGGAPEELDGYLDELRRTDLTFTDAAESSDLYVLYSVDQALEGGAERDVFLAGGQGTYVVLVRGFDVSSGDYAVQLERTRSADLLADRARYESVFSTSELTFEEYSTLFG